MTYIARIWKQDGHSWKGVRYADPQDIVSVHVGQYLHDKHITPETLTRFTANDFRRVLMECDIIAENAHTAEFQRVVCDIVSRDVLVLIRSVTTQPARKTQNTLVPN